MRTMSSLLSGLVSGLLLGLAGLTALGSGAAAQYDRTHMLGIYGDDDRRVIEERGPPWSAIGRVNHAGDFCTGTLIAPDKVLTAAHCIWNKRTRKWLPLDTLRFLPGYRMGSFLAAQTVASVQKDPGLVMDEQGRPRTIAMDWAVLTLKAPIPSSKELQPIPPMTKAEMAAVEIGRPMVRAGYSQDRPHLPTSAPCQLLDRSDLRLIAHNCDGTRGDSGSPILIETAAGWRVFALHVGVIDRDEYPFGVGVLIPEFLLK